MNIKRHLESLSQKELTSRREALRSVLSSEGISFSCAGDDRLTNFMFSSDGQESGCLFTAHYDNFRNSTGANDNMSSVCVLIDLRQALSAKNIRADFLFSDGEEDNHSGAEFFAANSDIKKYTGIINLDLCGYGDVIVVHGRLHKFTARSLLARHNAESVKYLPESDDVIFRKYAPTVSVSIVPKWDVQYLRALASFGEGLLGRPPEFYMILSQMEITQTFHNNAKDSPEYVDDLAMTKVYDYLLDAMTNSETEPKFSFKQLIRRLLA